MYFLTDTTKSLSCRTLEGINLAYGALDCISVYVPNSSEGRVGLDRSPVSVLSDVGDSYTEIVPAPALSHVQNSVKSIHVNNTDNITHNLEFSILGKILFKCRLQPNWTASYMNEEGWSIYDDNGQKQEKNNINRVLYQANPGPVLTDLYIVPNGKRAEIKISLCNTDGNGKAFRLALAKNGSADSPEQYIYYDHVSNANESHELNVIYELYSGDIVRVYGSTTDISFTVNGIEY